MAMKSRPSLFKAIMAPGALQRLYQLRQEGRPEAGARSRPAIALSLFLLATATALLISTAWVPHDVRSYLASRPDIHPVEESSQRWVASPMTYEECDFGPSCLGRLRSLAVPKASLGEIDTLQNAGPGKARLLVGLNLPLDAFAPLSSLQVVTLSLPGFNFYRADLYIDGTFSGTFYQGQRLAVGLETEALTKKTGDLRIEAVFEVLQSDRTLAGNRNQEGVLVASQGEFERYRDFLGTKRANAAGSMGHLSKIVLAIFCLLLFLIVDSSAESYGLALFMGFEAAAMGIGEGWLPIGYLGIDRVPVFVNFFYQMGDILKLFFLMQMARVGKVSAVPWLIIGAVVSVPYGFFMEYAGQHDITWVYKIPRSRDTFVGVVGAAVCLAAVYAIRGKSLPWRRAALLIAATAAAFEVINTWIAHSDLMRIYPQMKTLFTVFQANCGYLFALSTFLNISTLENRVKSLTAAAARADAIERELEIGQIVQRALLRPPELPGTVDLLCHHEAALYVSGDTYYAHWDRTRHVVSFLVSDVTGHGVQAALKASACNVLAKTLWEVDPTGQIDRFGAGEGRRLAELDRLTQKLMVEMDAIPDFNSLCGCEFNLQTGRLAIYRSNFTFPIVVSPREAFDEHEAPVLGEFWAPEVVASRNQEIVFKQLKRGSFVLLMSDGFMESSRDYKQFNEYLRRQLAHRETNVTVKSMTDMILRHEAFNRKLTDDRTLMVFQWTTGVTKVLSGDDSAEAESVDLRGTPAVWTKKDSA